MTDRSSTPFEVATGVVRPELPTVLPGGRVVLVESYRSLPTVVGLDGIASDDSCTAGAPNDCMLGADGLLAVYQSRRTCGPWRDFEMSEPSTKHIGEGGRPEILLTEDKGANVLAGRR